jgi:hypothetical protein
MPVLCALLAPPDMDLQIAPVPGLDEFIAGGDVEQKFTFRWTDKDVLWDWLEFHTLRDPSFYRGPIISLYYDTPSLDFYGEARNGDYLKTKVRLRWYQTVFTSADQTIDCFFEIKRKRGALRHKQRQALALSAGCLSGDVFSSAQIANLPREMGGFSCFNRGILVPMLVVEYQRCRYVDAQTGARIALDFAIGCRRANDAYVYGSVPIESALGVLEVKSKGAELPEFLRPMRRYLNRQSFSKYALCCQRLLDPLAWRYG